MLYYPHPPSPIPFNAHTHTHTQEIDLKAGGGYTVTIGEMCRMMLTKLEWFGTLFPRIPVNVQKELEEKLSVAQRTAR